MKKTLIWIASAVLATMAMTSHAESLSDDDQTFLKKATISNLFEIRTSKVALELAQRKDVRDFAQMMIDDHTKAAEDLKATVSSANLKAKIPEDLDEEHREKLNDLKKEEPDDFDEDYIELQIDAHEKAISLFEDYAEDGDNKALRQFAKTTLPVLRQHEKRIKQIEEAK